MPNDTHLASHQDSTRSPDVINSDEDGAFFGRGNLQSPQAKWRSTLSPPQTFVGKARGPSEANWTNSWCGFNARSNSCPITGGSFLVPLGFGFIRTPEILGSLLSFSCSRYAECCLKLLPDLYLRLIQDRLWKGNSEGQMVLGWNCNDVDLIGVVGRLGIVVSGVSFGEDNDCLALAKRVFCYSLT